MKEAIFTIGVPASGKSTWAAALSDKGNKYIVITRDDIRFSIVGSKEWSSYSFNKQNEELVTAIQKDIIKNASNLNKNIIICDTNLNETYRNLLEQYCESLGYTIRHQVFHITFEEAIQRDSKRINGVGITVISKMFEQYYHYCESVLKSHYIQEYDKNKKDCWIIDVDGTLAIKSSERGYFDWRKVDLDYPNQYVIDLVKNIKDDIIIVSGRDEVCRDLTVEWLEKYGIKYKHLYMRPTNNYQRDIVIKQDIFDEYIKDNYNVKCVIDDRPCCVRLWRSMGIDTLAVGNQYNNF